MAGWAAALAIGWWVLKARNPQVTQRREPAFEKVGDLPGSDGAAPYHPSVRSGPSVARRHRADALRAAPFDFLLILTDMLTITQALVDQIVADARQDHPDEARRRRRARRARAAPSASSRCSTPPARPRSTSSSATC